MAAFRIFSRLNTFYGLTGQLLAGGELRFYDAGTTTPRDVYGDSDLTVNNGTSVDLDSSGRPNVDVWGDGAYFVEAYDSLGVKQGEADDVQIPGAGGQTIPALETGKFLTNNGAVLLWSAIREVPDPTGQGGKVLGTDGENLLWQAPPTLPDIPPPDQAIGPTSARIGTFLIQWGTGSAAATGTDTTTANVTFPTAFSAAPYFAKATVTVGPTVNGTSLVADSVTAASATGCTFNFNNADRHFDGSSKLTSAIPFQWIAFGPVAAP